MTAFSYGGPEPFGEVRKPRRSVEAARIAQLSPEGADHFLDGQDREVQALNRVALVGRVAEDRAKQLTALRRHDANLAKQLGWTPRSLTKRRTDPVSRPSIFLAAVLAAIAVASMAVGNAVLTGYVVESSSPLFANNRTHATLFSLLPAIAAVALQQYESCLSSAKVRHYLSHAVAVAGAIGLCIWLWCTAVTFRPSAGGALDLLASDETHPWAPIALVLSTITSEVCFGSIILKRISHLLSAETLEAVPNPEFIALTREKARLERQLACVAREQMHAEDYLSRAAAMREVTRLEALHELEKARELWLQAQTAALSFAIAMFLSSSPEEND